MSRLEFLNSLVVRLSLTSFSSSLFLFLNGVKCSFALIAKGSLQRLDFINATIGALLHEVPAGSDNLEKGRAYQEAVSLDENLTLAIHGYGVIAIIRGWLRLDGRARSLDQTRIVGKAASIRIKIKVVRRVKSDDVSYANLES